MSFEHWDILSYGIQQGECILFLGPQLPLRVPEGSDRVPSEELGSQLLEKLEPKLVERWNLKDGNLAQIAQHYLNQEGELSLEAELHSWHKGLLQTHSVLHEDLAALPFRRVITGCFDPLMEGALKGVGKEPYIGHYHYRGRNPELLPEASVKAPILFHLLGSISEPASVVLSDLQLLDFLAAVIAQTPPLPNDLKATLTQGRMFLFLGFGLQQWYLRILLHVLKVLRRGSRSFAVEFGEEHLHPPVADAVIFYQQNFKVDVCQEDVFTFVAELRKRCRPMRAENGADGTTAGSDDDAPRKGSRVFICHASEDAEQARSISETLRRSGLTPWLDKESLRGGDQWDSLIKKTIEEEVDFVVVINSRNLEEKSRGRSYVNKEIKTAVESMEWRFGEFIIPVRIDATPLLSHLSAFHAVDFTAEDGARQLVRAIKRQSREP